MFILSSTEKPFGAKSLESIGKPDALKVARPVWGWGQGETPWPTPCPVVHAAQREKKFTVRRGGPRTSLFWPPNPANGVSFSLSFFSQDIFLYRKRILTQNWNLTQV